MTRTILFAGGGTLGSVTPLLAVSAELKKRRPDWRQLWVGTTDGPERSWVEPRLPFVGLPTVKLRRYWSWATIGDLFRLPAALWQARHIIQSTRPDVIVGAGGYVSVPIGWMGKLAGAKLVIHQQDVRPGLANKILAPWASLMTLSFPSATTQFPSAKTRVTGNPVRPEILESQAARGRALFNIPEGQVIVLIVGGGTGSAALNTLTEQLRPIIRSGVVIVHLSGPSRGQPDVTEPTYIRRATLTAGIGDLIAAATVVVTRAGLGTLSELSALKKAAIIIPMPETHQEENAAAIEALQAGLVLDQRQTTVTQLHAAIRRLLDHPDLRDHLSERMGEWNKPGAAGAISTLIEQLLVT